MNILYTLIRSFSEAVKAAYLLPENADCAEKRVLYALHSGKRVLYSVAETENTECEIVTIKKRPLPPWMIANYKITGSGSQIRTVDLRIMIPTL